MTYSIVKREETILTIVERFRELSMETIMFHQAIADVLGLHITDHKSLDLIYRFGPMPAGKLGDLTGLTNGAVTGIIDRLEKAGYVKRKSDPNDRRKTIVESAKNRKLENKIEEIFMPLHERMYKLLSSYSDNELAFLLKLMTVFIEYTDQESNRLRNH
jgi:DNA-binding MarR family transcriptional regulator